MAHARTRFSDSSCSCLVLLFVSLLLVVTNTSGLSPPIIHHVGQAPRVLLRKFDANLTLSLLWNLTEDYVMPENETLFYRVRRGQTIYTSGAVRAAENSQDLPISSLSVTFQPPQQGVQPWLIEVALDQAFTNTSSAEYEARVMPGGLTIMPPVIVVVLATVTKDVYIALFMGVWFGSFIIHDYNPWIALLRIVDTYFIQAVADQYKIMIILFTWFLAGLCANIYRNGGGYGLAQCLTKYAKTRRMTQFIVYLLGWVIFYDGYSSALIVGNTMRSVVDSMYISREKFAYIVDSMSGPVAAVAPISSWVGFELSQISAGFTSIQETYGDDPTALYDTQVYLVFLKSIVSRYYPWFVLILQVDSRLEPEDNTPRCWWNAVVPMGAVASAVLIGFSLSGYYTIKESGGNDFSAQNIFSNANSYKALLWASFLVSVAVWVASYLQWKDAQGNLVAPVWRKLFKRSFDKDEPQPIMTFRESVTTFIRSFERLTATIVVLVLAWTIALVMVRAGTGRYIAEGLVGHVDADAIPLLTFILCAIISFSTGTSWGTMAIMFPIAIPTIHIAARGDQRLMMLTISSILAGVVFGDHCGLMSDTTILSAMATRCDVGQHVNTQIPYALFAATFAVLVGYLPAGYNAGPAWVWLLVGMAITAAAAYLLGVPVDQPDRVDLISRIRYRLKNRHINLAKVDDADNIPVAVKI